MIKPPFLKSGDKIGIVSPAGKIAKELVEPGILLLEELGFEVIRGEYIYSGTQQMAGSDEQRLSDLQQMINSPELKAIFATRGGYGIIRLIDKLDFEPLKKHPKWIVGYSDLTILHNHIHQNLDICSLHSLMVKEYSSCTPSSLKTLQEALSGEQLSYKIKSHPNNKTGTTKGIITGGNLSILCSLIGSNSEVNTRNKILFIEDLGEHHYHLDRLMRQLKRANKLKNLKGLIVGSFSDLEDEPSDFGMNIIQIIQEAIEEYDYPVCYNFPAGHTTKNNALILGAEINMYIDEVTTKIVFN